MYNKSDNLFGRPIYSDLGLTEGYVHSDMIPLLQDLNERLLKESFYLLIYDAYRPKNVQIEMWNILPDSRYVAPPEKGSKHNRGCAIDCYLLDKNKTPLDFPTTPDGYYMGCRNNLEEWLIYLEKASHSFICSPEESIKQRNREKLLSLMEKSGFISLDEEWWHYELPNAECYPIITDFC